MSEELHADTSLPWCFVRPPDFAQSIYGGGGNGGGSGDAGSLYSDKNSTLSSATATAAGAGAGAGAATETATGAATAATFRNSDGATCIPRGTQSLFTSHNVSRSSVFLRGTAPAADAMEKRLEEVLGLPRWHAYHGQTVSYGGGSGYKLHTDCHLDTSVHKNNRA
eukprot:UC1_evm2s49